MDPASTSGSRPSPPAATRRLVAQRARLRMLFRRATSLVDAVAVEAGLSPAQYHVLLALAAAATDEGLHESELVRSLEASRAHVSVLVRRLSELGLVDDWRDDCDRRQLRLAVTPAGWDLLARLGERQERALHEFVGGLDPGEVSDIIDQVASRYLRLPGRR